MADVQTQIPLPVAIGSPGTGTFTVCLTEGAIIHGIADGPVTPGTPAAKCTLVGGVFNAALPTPTTGQQLALQLDSAGRLLTNGSGATQPVSGQGVFNVALTELNQGIVHYYGTAAGVANTTTATLSYTVSPDKTFYVKGVQAASSVGPCKVQFQSQQGKNPPGIFATSFYSALVPHVEINFPQPIGFPAGTVISVTIQNYAGPPQDVYAFINGHEV